MSISKSIVFLQTNFYISLVAPAEMSPNSMPGVSILAPPSILCQQRRMHFKTLSILYQSSVRADRFPNWCRMQGSTQSSQGSFWYWIWAFSNFKVSVLNTFFIRFQIFTKQRSFANQTRICFLHIVLFWAFCFSFLTITRQIWPCFCCMCLEMRRCTESFPMWSFLIRTLSLTIRLLNVEMQYDNE